MSKISWTGETWNPIAGCTKVSAGCDNCYAIPEAIRMAANPLFAHYNGTAEMVDGNPEWTGKINTSDKALGYPEKLKQPTLIFVNSMSDIFHEDVPTEFIDKIYDVMEKFDRHIYQVLTKRDAGMKKYVNARYADRDPPKHIWHGVSVETANLYPRIRRLQETKSAIRFLSLEPLLGPLPDLPLDGIDWVIVGGESGPNFRDMDLDHARGVRNQCGEKDVAFFYKQAGGGGQDKGGNVLDNSPHQNFPIENIDDYERGVELNDEEKAEKIVELAKSVNKIKTRIERGYKSRFDAFVEAGAILNRAKIGVKQTGGKWNDWLEKNEISPRTARRAMQFCNDPNAYEIDRAKAAAAMKKKRDAAAGEGTGPTQAMLVRRLLINILKDATDEEIEALYELIKEDDRLSDLAQRIQAITTPTEQPEAA